jgi:hypothetical protein
VRFVHSGIAIAALAVGGCARAAAALPNGADGRAASEGFAIVELFTSESCSSCPPADDLLRELAIDAAQSGRHVYPLAFHVDYWNDLGWRDRFSSAWATRRQRAYSEQFGKSSVYTPQMIVNGSDAFVGSERERALQSIEQALATPAAAHITLRSINEPGALAVEYGVSAAAPNTTLQIALVERQAASEVTSGENTGRTLRHANVVRAFRTVSMFDSTAGQVAFPIGSDKTTRYEVIAYLQDQTTLRVSAATRADF